MKTFVQRTTKSDEWATPGVVFARIERDFGPFDLDPAATKENRKAKHYFTRAENGLEQEWFGCVFVNPPFSQIKAWVQKAYESSQTGCRVVMLIPARTGTAWWHEWVQNKATVVFLRGRIRYEGAPFNAPFDSCVAIYYPPGALRENPARNFGSVA
jgi:phage N-6-adenine-methyltransferase